MRKITQAELTRIKEEFSQYWENKKQPGTYKPPVHPVLGWEIKYPAQVVSLECEIKTRAIDCSDADERYVFNDRTNEFLGLGYIDRSEPNSPTLMVSITGDGTDYEVAYGLFEPVINFCVMDRPADYFNVRASG